MKTPITKPKVYLKSTENYDLERLPGEYLKFFVRVQICARTCKTIHDPAIKNSTLNPFLFIVFFFFIFFHQFKTVRDLSRILLKFSPYT